jgi:hypothetical protein
MKPLFIPLKSEYYEAFKNGTKREELRRYGPHWNTATCIVGRRVILSKGYGKKDRMTGVVSGFKKQHAVEFGPADRDAIFDCFGTLNVWIACISIEID